MAAGTVHSTGMSRSGRQPWRWEEYGESYFVPYVEPLSDAKTMLAGFFNNC